MVFLERAASYLGRILCICTALILTFLSLLRPAEAGVSYVQGNSGTSNQEVSTVSVTYSSAQAAGDLNVVFVGWDNATYAVQSITDTSGNTYVAAVGPTVNSSGATQTIYYATNISAAAAGANAVTVTFSNSVSYPDVRILEYSGINTTNPLDTAIAAYGNGATLNSGSLTITAANDLLVAGGYGQHAYTGGAGAGYTEVLTSEWELVEDAIVATVGSYSATSSDNSGYWVMQMVAFRIAGNSNDTTPPTTPTGLIATSSSGNEINLTWTPATDNVGVTAYLIGRCQGAGCSNFVQINATAGNSYSDTNIAASTSYSYRVLATDAAGNLSAYSNVASATTTLAAGAVYVQGNSSTPGSAGALSVTYTSTQVAGDLNVVFVGWNEATNIVHSITDTSGNTYAAAVGPTVNSSGATQTIYYATNISAAAAGANAVTVTFSNSVSYPDVRILEYSGINTTNPFDVAVAAYGTGATLNSGSLTTTVTNDLLVASGYGQYEYTGGAGAGFTEILTSEWNLVEDANVKTVGTYDATSSLDSPGYWVMEMAAFQVAVPAGDTTPPSVPGGLTVTAVSTTQVNLSWSASSDNVAVDGYFIGRCLGVGCTDFAFLGTSTTTTFTDTDVAPSNYYTYQVQAVDEAGNLSDGSNWVWAATGSASVSGGSGGSTGSGGSSGSGNGGTSGGGSGSGGTAASVGQTTYTYDVNGHLLKATTAGGGTTTYTYDAAGHLIGLHTSP
jgi:YD repeat-containing protein